MLAKDTVRNIAALSCFFLLILQTQETILSLLFVFLFLILLFSFLFYLVILSPVLSFTKPISKQILLAAETRTKDLRVSSFFSLKALLIMLVQMLSNEELREKRHT